MKKEENQRVRLTKRLLRDSLIDSLNKKDISKVSVKELCEKAELNRTTFYAHYDSPEDILNELEKDVIDKTREHLQNVKPTTDTVEYVTSFLRYVKENSELFTILFRSSSSRSFKSKFIEEAMAITRSGIPFKATEKEKSLIYAYLFNGSLAIIETWLDSGFALPEKQVAALIFNLSDKALTAAR